MPEATKKNWGGESKEFFFFDFFCRQLIKDGLVLFGLAGAMLLAWRLFKHLSCGKFSSFRLDLGR